MYLKMLPCNIYSVNSSGGNDHVESIVFQVVDS